jgi:hypothetical protein
MGIVILGQRWQQERWQALQLKWQASINNEVLFPESFFCFLFFSANQDFSLHINFF